MESQETMAVENKLLVKDVSQKQNRSRKVKVLILPRRAVKGFGTAGQVVSMDRQTADYLVKIGYVKIVD